MITEQRKLLVRFLDLAYKKGILDLDKVLELEHFLIQEIEPYDILYKGVDIVGQGRETKKGKLLNDN